MTDVDQGATWQIRWKTTGDRFVKADGTEYAMNARFVEYLNTLEQRCDNFQRAMLDNAGSVLEREREITALESDNARLRRELEVLEAWSSRMADHLSSVDGIVAFLREGSLLQATVYRASALARTADLIATQQRELEETKAALRRRDYSATLTDDDGELCLELTNDEGTEVTWFIDETMLPETVATTRHDREIPVHEVRITSVRQLFELLRPDRAALRESA